ncbi:MAG TPA: M10 family metallopeptidase C-terminal domain-containing protein [Roseomonas sp.]|jgi:serralysin
MAAWEKAVQGWEHVANIDFVRVTNIGDAKFIEALEDQLTATGTVSASHQLPTTGASEGTYNFEAVNVRQWSADMLEPGGNFYRTFIHETGHGLGLKHPHDGGNLPNDDDPHYFPGITEEDSSAVRQRSLGVLELNHMFGSVMSYLHGYEFDENGRIDVVATRQRPVADDFFLDHGFAATPMAYDVAAIQYLYGANMEYRTEDNVYILPDSNDPHPFVRGAPNEVGVPESIIYQPDTAFWECLWDAGGIDEIRYDVKDADGNTIAGKANAIIDLTAATLDYSETGYGVLSYAAFIGGGYTIANGVVIENATGGDGNDLITGNAADNVLLGRGGNDEFHITDGNDRIDGGDGADVAVFIGKFTDYAVSKLGAMAIVEDGGLKSSLTNVETLRFDDRDISLADMGTIGHLTQLVDDLFYQSTNPDVLAAGMDPKFHYDTFGRFEGRDPNQYFDTSAYLEANPDVAAYGMNPLEHYLNFGGYEGRLPSEAFDGNAYLAANPDVAAAGMNPLFHYMMFGAAEGRAVIGADDLV